LGKSGFPDFTIDYEGHITYLARAFGAIVLSSPPHQVS
jgi:hypothetical protein